MARMLCVTALLWPAIFSHLGYPVRLDKGPMSFSDFLAPGGHVLRDAHSN